MTKLRLGHIDKLKIKIEKVSRLGSPSPDNADVVVLQRTAKCIKNYNAFARLLYILLIKETFCLATFTVSVVVFLKFGHTENIPDISRPF